MVTIGIRIWGRTIEVGDVSTCIVQLFVLAKIKVQFSLDFIKKGDATCSSCCSLFHVVIQNNILAFSRRSFLQFHLKPISLSI